MGVARVAVILAGLAFLASGCDRTPSDPRLLNMASSASDGPDEFGIVPGKPLQTPTTLASLPEPTPGGQNLADPDPEAEAVAALGGDPRRLSGGGISDPALVSHVTRFGASPGIRDELAREDLEFRRKNDGRLLERVFNVNVYYRAYRPLELDQYRELERFRALGVRTPTAPPNEDG